MTVTLEKPTITTIEQMAQEYKQQSAESQRRIVICAGTGCVANGSMKVHKAFEEQLQGAGVDVRIELEYETEDSGQCSGALAGEGFTHISRSGCQGFCQMGPLVRIEPEEIFYVKVTPDDVSEIIETTLQGGGIVERLLYIDPTGGQQCKTQAEIPFYERQSRKVLKECGAIDPSDVREYVFHGGYSAARKAFVEMSPEKVCEELVLSGLRGRGGGGFPTGKKWELTLREKSEQKYVICNGDEGDPGAFMDRSVMEGNPHSIIEGMMIAARAIGADKGYVYVRLEYPLAVERIKQAVDEAERLGLLGENLFNSGLSFRVEVMEGAGAFVCGEETALMASIEGRRGMPLPKPPFPAQCGLWGKPTVINNVETLASVPAILRQGAHEYRSVGTKTSPGTKTFALTGHVVNTGLIEVPFGTTLREIVFDIGGGVTGPGFKAVQIGGPSGGCLTEEHLDLPLDFDSLRSVGAMVGSGGLVVMNRDTCMVKIARFFMQFTQNESCGKCVLCREGTKQMLALLDDIIEGRGSLQTLDLLAELGQTVAKGSLCGLGKTAPGPVLSTMKQFRTEYEAHVIQKRCPAKQCKALRVPEIDRDLCRGCTLCARKCPVGAISGERKQPHTIDPEKCIRCGVCTEVCKFNAVV